MTPADGAQPGDRLVDLACRYLDGVLSPDEFRELDAMLGADASQADRFAGLCLQGRLLADSLSDRIRSGSRDTAPAPQIPGDAKHTAVRSRALRDVLRIAAVVLLGLSLWFAGVFIVNRANTDAPVDPVHEVEPIGTLIAASAVEWISTPAAPGGDLVPGELSIASGSLDVYLQSGVTLTVTGPADIDLRDAMRIGLSRGSVHARVPHSAVGFVVDSPGGQVIDRGTVFTVAVDPDAAFTWVDVIEGAVDAKVFDDDGGPVATRRLTTGMTGRIEPAAQRIVVARPALARRYGEHVMRLGPTAYWPLDGAEPGVIRNRLDGSEATNNVGARSGDDGPFGASTRFVGNHGGVIIGHRDLLPPTGDFTVNLWFRTTQTSQGHLLSDNRGFVGRANLHTHDGELRWFVGVDPQVHVVSEPTVADDRWHMATLTRRRGVFTLYVDGEPADTVASDAVIAPAQPDWAIGGAPHGNQFGFDGWLAQLTVFDRSLEPDEIEALYRYAPRQPDDPDLRDADETSRNDDKAHK